MRLFYVLILVFGVKIQVEAQERQEITGPVSILVKEEMEFSEGLSHTENLSESDKMNLWIRYLKKENADPEIVTGILISAQDFQNEQNKTDLYDAYLANSSINSECVLIILEECYDLRPEEKSHKADFWGGFFRPHYKWLYQKQHKAPQIESVVQEAVRKSRRAEKASFLSIYNNMFLDSDEKFNVEKFATYFGVENSF